VETQHIREEGTNTGLKARRRQEAVGLVCKAARGLEFTRFRGAQQFTIRRRIPQQETDSVRLGIANQMISTRFRRLLAEKEWDRNQEIGEPNAQAAVEIVQRGCRRPRGGDKSPQFGVSQRAAIEETTGLGEEGGRTSIVGSSVRCRSAG